MRDKDTDRDVKLTFEMPDRVLSAEDDVVRELAAETVDDDRYGDHPVGHRRQRSTLRGWVVA